MEYRLVCKHPFWEYKYYEWTTDFSSVSFLRNVGELTRDGWEYIIESRECI